MVVSAAGFKQRVREGVVLKATKAKVAGIDITLEVGAVTETADGTTKTRTVGVVTTAPGPVGLVSPVNYAIIGSGSTATVTWHAATDAEFYDIYLGVVSQSMSQVGHVAAPTTQFTVGVLSSTSYSWCVVATNTAGSSTSCSNFTTPPSGWFSGQ